MAVASYLSSTHRFIKSAMFVDFADILTILAAELPAGGWTDEGGNQYKSPVDADGRFFKVLFTAVAATNLEMKVYDQSGNLISQRRAYASVTASYAFIFSGPFHIIIDVFRAGAAAEWLCGGILDPAPESASVITRYTYGGGSRDSGNVLANSNWGYAGMRDNITSTYDVRANHYVNDGAALSFTKTLSGKSLFHPRELFASTASLTYAWAGRCYQQILVDQYAGDDESLISVPIDTGVMGAFRIIGGALVVYGQRLACRVG